MQLAIQLLIEGAEQSLADLLALARKQLMTAQYNPEIAAASLAEIKVNGVLLDGRLRAARAEIAAAESMPRQRAPLAAYVLVEAYKAAKLESTALFEAENAMAQARMSPEQLKLFNWAGNNIDSQPTPKQVLNRAEKLIGTARRNYAEAMKRFSRMTSSTLDRDAVVTTALAAQKKALASGDPACRAARTGAGCN